MEKGTLSVFLGLAAGYKTSVLGIYIYTQLSKTMWGEPKSAPAFSLGGGGVGGQHSKRKTHMISVYEELCI